MYVQMYVHKIFLLRIAVDTYNYHNGSFIRGMNISRMTILVTIRNFIFKNLLAS